MADINKIVDELKQTHDELKLQVHLGSKEVQDEWATLEEKWNAFESKAKLSESMGDIGEAAGKLGSELSDAFRKIKAAL